MTVQTLTLTFTFLLILNTFSPLHSLFAETVFPGKTWEQASPETQGLDSEKTEAAMDQLNSRGGSDGIAHTLIVVIRPV